VSENDYKVHTNVNFSTNKLTVYECKLGLLNIVNNSMYGQSIKARDITNGNN